MTWYEVHPKICSVLAQHFPASSAEEHNLWGDEIYNSWSASSFVQAIEGNDRHPSKDKESLQKVMELLEKASKEFGKIGWHGCKALEQLATNLANKTDKSVYPVHAHILGVKTVLADHIAEITDQVAHAKKEISDDAPSVLAVIGEGPEFDRKDTKPTKTAAMFVAKECAEAFYSLGGERPTVRTCGGTAYGPFLDFVTNVFSALDIEASPEVWAKNAAKKT